MKDVELYAKVRHAVRIEGLSKRAVARRFGIDPRTVDKMLEFSVPPGYRRSKPPVKRKRRLDDIGFPIDAGGFSGACGNIVCNKDCNICCKALRQFWREVCG
jgi:hypothetical protein